MKKQKCKIFFDKQCPQRKPIIYSVEENKMSSNLTLIFQQKQYIIPYACKLYQMVNEIIQ